MMSQLTLAGKAVAGVVAIDPGMLAEAVGLTGNPSGTWLIPELLVPAWNASTPPITRPSATGTASWAVIRAAPLPRMRRRQAVPRPSDTRSTSHARRFAPAGIR